MWAERETKGRRETRRETRGRKETRKRIAIAGGEAWSMKSGPDKGVVTDHWVFSSFAKKEKKLPFPVPHINQRNEHSTTVAQ
jgi:hypothetical protein